MTPFNIRLIALMLGLAVSVFAGPVRADPPGRVARLGYLSGPVSFSPAGEDEWSRSTLNRPLTTGARLWSAAGARAVDRPVGEDRSCGGPGGLHGN